MLRGALVERFRDRADADDVPLDARKLRTAGTFVVPPTRVHEVRNPFRADALSVHVYSPPLGTASDLG